MDQSLTIKRTLAPMLYLLQNLHGKAGRHKLLKLLYFADRNHIGKFGRTITGDRYFAMKYGPVPSGLFDFIKLVAGENDNEGQEEVVQELRTYFHTSGKEIVAKKEVDFDFLSKSEIESLDFSLNEYKHKNFTELCDLSHGPAWKSTYSNGEISEFEIAKEAGANEHMLNYMKVAR